MRLHYVLDDKKPVRADLMQWAQWFKSADRRVAKTSVGGRSVSTVFLGIDHNFDMDGPPILFETMVFHKDDGNDDPWHDYQVRHPGSWEQAEEGHRRLVQLVKDNPAGPPEGER